MAKILHFYCRDISFGRNIMSTTCETREGCDFVRYFFACWGETVSTNVLGVELECSNAILNGNLHTQK